jgi:hypothetical protein
MTVRSQFCLALCASCLTVIAACGGSRPIQEEPNAPSGASPTIPGPQTGDPTQPTVAPPPPDPAIPGTPPPGGTPDPTAPTPTPGAGSTK